MDMNDLEPIPVGLFIERRRRQLGLSLQQVADFAGCVRSYLWQIERGKRAKPPSESLLTKLESSLKLEPGSLIRAARWESTPLEIRERQRTLEREVRLPRSSASSASTVHQVPLLGLVETLPMLGTAERPPHAKSAASVVGGAQYVQSPDIDDPDAFAARVIGDGMSPTFLPGDVVIFSPARQASSGDDCWVELADAHAEASPMLSRIYFDGELSNQTDAQGASSAKAAALAKDADRVRLQPVNCSCPPMIVARAHIHRLCVAVGLVRSLRS